MHCWMMLAVVFNVFCETEKPFSDALNSIDKFDFSLIPDAVRCATNSKIVRLEMLD